MKNLIYFSLLIIFAGLNACNKTSGINISETQLTTCDNGANCDYIFTLSSDVDSDFHYVADGNHKVFTYKKNFGSNQTNLFILAPKTGNSFSISNNEIKNGLVKVQFISPLGLSVGFKAVGGEVKGKNLPPEKALDQSKWLIDAKIYLAADAKVKGDQKIKDTLYLKQYFYPNFVFD
jgi:hypothetical protein